MLFILYYWALLNSCTILKAVVILSHVTAVKCEWKKLSLIDSDLSFANTRIPKGSCSGLSLNCVVLGESQHSSSNYRHYFM